MTKIPLDYKPILQVEEQAGAKKEDLRSVQAFRWLICKGKKNKMYLERRRAYSLIVIVSVNDLC
jgi:hypothetical protein